MKKKKRKKKMETLEKKKTKKTKNVMAIRERKLTNAPNKFNLDSLVLQPLAFQCEVNLKPKR